MAEEVNVTVHFPKAMQSEAMAFLMEYQAAINRGEVPHEILMQCMLGGGQ
jgi:hypothetical protein